VIRRANGFRLRSHLRARECTSKRSATGHKAETTRGLADDVHMSFEKRVDDRHARASSGQRIKPASKLRGTSLDRLQGNPVNGSTALPCQHSHQIRIGHRIQRVMTHRRFRQKLALDEQMRGVRRATQSGVRGTGNRE
jgi:hypothetical protein